MKFSRMEADMWFHPAQCPQTLTTKLDNTLRKKG